MFPQHQATGMNHSVSLCLFLSLSPFAVGTLSAMALFQPLRLALFQPGNSFSLCIEQLFQLWQLFQPMHYHSFLLCIGQLFQPGNSFSLCTYQLSAPRNFLCWGNFCTKGGRLVQFSLVFRLISFSFSDTVANLDLVLCQKAR